MDKSEIFE